MVREMGFMLDQSTEKVKAVKRVPEAMAKRIKEIDARVAEVERRE